METAFTLNLTSIFSALGQIVKSSLEIFAVKTVEQPPREIHADFSNKKCAGRVSVKRVRLLVKFKNVQTCFWSAISQFLWLAYMTSISHASSQLNRNKMVGRIILVDCGLIRIQSRFCHFELKNGVFRSLLSSFLTLANYIRFNFHHRLWQFFICC